MTTTIGCGTKWSLARRMRCLTACWSCGEELQLSQIVFEHNAGRRIPHDLHMNSQRLLADKVLPHLN